MNNKQKVCHITTVHPRFDIRIFHKECKSLAKHYNVYLIVADGLGNEIKDNINIVDIGKRQISRLKRIKIDSKRALQKAVELNCESYHFHDPELMTIALMLKKRKKKVFYDVHEDLPRQSAYKNYIPKLLKPILAFLIEKYEQYVSKRIDGVFTSTDFIKQRFLKYNKNTEQISNYPLLSEKKEIKWSDRKNEICYVGGITINRGIIELLDSLSFHSYKLNLAGKFVSTELEEICKNHKNWNKVNYYGFVGREKIIEILNISKIGIVTLHPIINYLDSLPIKMFEYMQAGLPFIASDFPFWQQIVNENNCGVYCNPLNPKDIAEKVNKIIENEELAELMGKNGKEAIKEKYNWTNEEEKLFNIYKNII